LVDWTFGIWPKLPSAGRRSLATQSLFKVTPTIVMTIWHPRLQAPLAGSMSVMRTFRYRPRIAQAAPN